MPGTNGVELAGKLKERDDTVPVIVITGHADVPLAIQAMKAGAADFIEKPFDDEAILAAIRKALNESTDDEQKQNERREVLDRLALLSARERQVVDGLVDGKANKVIAFDLDISPRTVEVYRANAMMKMQAKTLSDLVRMVTIARLG
jgi:two-component system response regulator FixJ